MSLADDLLNFSAGMNSRLADMETEPHIIIGEDRFISVPDELKRVAVQYDHRVETVTFDCPRYWDGKDMSKMKIYINYTRADSLLGMYIAENVFADEQLPNIMHFDWTLTRNVTGINGPIVFMVCVKRVDRDGNEEVHWNSERNEEMYISEGLEGEEVIQDLYPDIFTQMLQKMDETVEETQAIKDSAVKETTEIKNSALREVTAVKTEAIKETTEVKDSAIQEMTSFKLNSMGEIQTIKSEAIKETTSIKNSAIKEINSVKSDVIDEINSTVTEIDRIKNETVTVFDQAIEETRELLDETQSYMDETNELHNETMEWVKEVTKIATPDAMKSYTTEYYENHPTAILEAVSEVCSLARNSDIDEIISGTHTPEPDVFEEEMGLTTNEDIDSIIDNTYVEPPEGGGDSGDDDPDEEDDTLVTDKELDDIIGDLFDEDDGENGDIAGGSGGVTDEDLDDIVGDLFYKMKKN